MVLCCEIGLIKKWFAKSKTSAVLADRLYVSYFLKQIQPISGYFSLRLLTWSIVLQLIETIRLFKESTKELIFSVSRDFKSIFYLEAAG